MSHDEIVDAIVQHLTDSEFEEASPLFLTVPESHRKVIMEDVACRLLSTELREVWTRMSQQLLYCEHLERVDDGKVITPSDLLCNFTDEFIRGLQYS